MKELREASSLLQQTHKALSNIFGETTAKDVLQVASQLLSHEIEKAENREKFSGLDDKAVQEKLEKEKQEAIRKNQEAAGDQLEKKFKKTANSKTKSGRPVGKAGSKQKQ